MGQIPEEQCFDFGCLKLKSVNYFSSCGQLSLCKNCKINPERHVSDICIGWKSNRLDKLQLAIGSLQSDLNVGSQFFRELRANWDGNNPIDISKCQLENFNYRKAYSAFSIGQYTALYSTVTFQVSIIELSKTDGRKRLPNLEVDLDLDESFEEINNRGMNRRAKIDKTLCPITHSNTPLKLDKKKIKGEVTLVSKSFSIPLYRTKLYRPYEFKIKVKCEKNKNCNMNLYKFCLKITCQRMPETQYAELRIVEELLNYRPRLNTEENEDEIEDEIEDENTIKSEIENEIDKQKQTRNNINTSSVKNKISPRESITTGTSMYRSRPADENTIRRGYDESGYQKTLNSFKYFQNNQTYIILIVVLIIFTFLFILVLRKRN